MSCPVVGLRTNYPQSDRISFQLGDKSNGHHKVSTDPNALPVTLEHWDYWCSPWGELDQFNDYCAFMYQLLQYFFYQSSQCV